MSEEKTWTAEEATAPDAGPSGRLEILRGRRRRRGLLGLREASIATRLLKELERHVRERGLGTVHKRGERFLIARDPDTLLDPEIAFVARGRLSEGASSPYLAVVPDLVVELSGLGDEPEADRAARWLEAGTREVWVLDPERLAVAVYTHGRPPRRVGLDARLEGGDVLPGFEMPASQLFGVFEPSRLTFVLIAGEASLVLVAAFLSWLFTGRLWPSFRAWIDGESLLWVAGATAPMALFAVLATSPLGLRFKPLHGIYRRLREILGPTIARMRFWQLGAASLAAGVGEEVLFRAVLQPAIGILATSAIFGLLHALTFTYLVLAFAISIYFGWLYETTDNLFVPIAVHALYDLVALLLFRRRFRSEEGETAPEG